MGAAHATVRLAVAGADDVVAHWPKHLAPGSSARSEYSEPVRDATGPLGEITVSMPPGRGVSRADRTLLADIATQAGLGMRTAQLAAELRVQVDQASAQTAELEASRLRLLAAQESQRRRLTRAVSAEVLPHLAGLRVGLAQAAGATDPVAASRLLDAAMETTNRALEALRNIARGIFPPSLARKGLAAALRQYAARTGGRVALTVSIPARTARLPSHLEAVMYFGAVETVREFGGSALVELDLDDSHLTLTVTAVDPSSRLADGGQGVIDRVLALGGAVNIDAQDAPVRLRVRFPHPPDMAQTSVNLSGPNADLAT
jgi:signal transduction histidine kinase